MSILDIAKKLKNFNSLSITKSASSVNPINSRRSNLISIKKVLPSIEIAEVPITIKPELIHRSITRDNSRLSSLDSEQFRNRRFSQISKENTQLADLQEDLQDIMIKQDNKNEEY